MEPSMTRKGAKAAGLRTYYTGKPCARGHLSERFTRSGNCAKCFSDARRRPDKEVEVFAEFARDFRVWDMTGRAGASPMCRACFGHGYEVTEGALPRIIRPCDECFGMGRRYDAAVGADPGLAELAADLVKAWADPGRSIAALLSLRDARK